MKLDLKERLEMLRVEMQLLQGTLDKYDQLIFQSRNWFITVWLGAIGLSFSIGAPDVALLAVASAGIYWLFEGLMRHQYWYKYVLRYRAIRDWLNDPDSDEALSVYDLTNHYGKRPANWPWFKKSFFKLEPTIVYLLMPMAAFAAKYFVPLSTQP